MAKDLKDESSVTNKKTTPKGGLRGWWNKRSTKGKAAIGICCVGLILMVIIGGTLSPDANTANTTNTNSDNSSTTHSNTQTTSNSNSPTPNFSVGTSKFYLSGGFTEGFNSGNGGEASRVRLDKTDTNIIVTEYSSKDLYKIESKNAKSYKTIDGVTVTKVPSALSVFFEKNGKYYSIAVNTVNGDGNTSPASKTSENQQYIQDIVGSMQNA